MTRKILKLLLYFQCLELDKSVIFLFFKVLNVAFWIGIVLMLFVPGYIYGNGLLKKLSDQPLSLSFNNAESTIIGILGSLMAFIYINVFNQIFGMRFLYQRKATFFRMVSLQNSVFTLYFSKCTFFQLQLYLFKILSHFFSFLLSKLLSILHCYLFFVKVT